MRVSIEKIIVTVLHEAHKRQVEETMETLAEGPEGLYKRLLYKFQVRGRLPTARTPLQLREHAGQDGILSALARLSAVTVLGVFSVLSIVPT